MHPLFRDRHDAGQQLAQKFLDLAGNSDIIVLALPRGGVPVAYEIAQALHAPLDLMLVRKLGAPGQKELAIGAIALPDICLFNPSIIAGIRATQDDIDAAIEREKAELDRRNRAYRGGRPPADLKGRIVILVDDGAATGATMQAAVLAAAEQKPERILVALPVAAKDAGALLEKRAEVICLHTPGLFFGVGQFYQDFAQTTDEEVLGFLAGKINKSANKTQKTIK